MPEMQETLSRREGVLPPLPRAIHLESRKLRQPRVSRRDDPPADLPYALLVLSISWSASSISLLQDPEIAAGHISRLLNAENSQQRRCDVAERTILAEPPFRNALTDNVKRYSVRRREPVRQAAGIEHLLAAPVRGRNDTDPASLVDLLDDAAEARVDVLNRFDRALETSRFCRDR